MIYEWIGFFYFDIYKLFFIKCGLIRVFIFSIFKIILKVFFFELKVKVIWGEFFVMIYIGSFCFEGIFFLVFRNILG